MKATVSSQQSASPAVTDPAELLAALRSLIGPQLIDVDALFTRELTSDLPCVAALTRHLTRFRGKMLRPNLLLLSGLASGHGRLTPAHTTLATVVEMVHMATLVHDDVLDDAELRRKGATINHLRGNEAAVMLGDFLISHAFHLCSSLESQWASRAIGRTTNTVCEGELLQIDQRHNLDLDEATYLTIIQRKTAALVATSCGLGARCSDAPPEQAAALEAYGSLLGTAFQIQDDLLDLTGDVRSVGKTLGVDAEKGKLTLPLIHFLRTAPLEHRELLRSLLTAHDADKSDRIRNLLLPTPSVPYTRDRARSLVAAARAALVPLPPSPARDLLDRTAEFVVTRAA